MLNVSLFLDRARWIAALAVASSHLRNFLLVDWPQVAHRTPFAAAFYWLTGFGRTSVIVFFVLSGYLVGGHALMGIKSGTFDIRDYAIHRVARLYPPLIAAILCTYILDSIGLRFGNLNGYYDFPNTFGIAGETHGISQALTVSSGLLNLLFMQTLAAPAFGTNTPLWSLANEFWYYVAGPIIGLLLFDSVRRHVPLLVALATAGIIVSLLNPGLLLLSTTWLAGAAAYCCARRPRLALSVGFLVLFLSVVATVRSIHWFPEHQLLSDLLVGGCFATLLWSLGLPARRSRSAPIAVSSRLAGFSYSLYLVHVPLCFLLAASILQRSGAGVRLQPGFNSLALFAGILALASVLAYGVAQLTEVRTGEVRAWLSRHLKSNAVPSSLPGTRRESGV